MRIKADKQRALQISEELLDVTRELRRAAAEIETVTLRLSAYTQIEACVRGLRVQRETVMDESVKLTMLSTALRDIASVYANAETRATEDLEGSNSPFRWADQIRATQVPDKYKMLFKELL